MIVFEENQDPINGVLLDSKLNISIFGKQTGSIITKVLDESNSIIFSDSIEIREEEETIVIEGLKIGIEGKSSISDKGKFTFKDFSKLHYSVLMDEEIIYMFDNARFGSSFPHMISFLNTTLLYHYSKENPVNHIDLIRGEIINHPIGLLYNDSIIVADRLVIDRLDNSIFYDSIIIKRNTLSDSDETISFDIEPLTFLYEPIFRINIHFFKYLVILGVEMLK